MAGTASVQQLTLEGHH